MRDFFWSQIPNKNVSGTLWTELNDEKVELNLDEIDELFGQKETATRKDEAEGEKEDEEKKLSKPKTRVARRAK